MQPFERVLAVDWSGALQGAERHIWLAEYTGNGLVRLEAGRSREQLAQHLIEYNFRGPRSLIGLDFAFGFPHWFARSHGAADGTQMWELAREQGERWLKECPPPFWGRPGRPRPPEPPSRPAWRRTETEGPAVRGIRPKSVFQVGGAGSVGTGSLRGMPLLAQLREAGLEIWPFAPPQAPLPPQQACVVTEIYPRLFTGKVHKSNRAQRALHLANHWPELDGAFREAAEVSEDAFDAACSARGLYAAREQFPPPGWPDGDWERIEGRIFTPRTEPFHTRP